MFPQVLKDLAGSEKAIFALLILIAITVFTALGKMTVTEWRTDALIILGIYTAGKTTQGVAETIMRPKMVELEAKLPEAQRPPDAP